VSSPQNVRITDITAHQVVLSWDRPVTNPDCVTGYYIANFNTRIGSEISGTTATKSITDGVCYSFAVVAMYGKDNIINSESVETICIKKPQTESTSFRASDTILSILWKFPSNIPPVFNQSIILNEMEYHISAIDRSWTFTFEKNENYTIILLATNAIGSSSITLFSGQPSKILFDFQTGFVVLIVITVFLILLLVLFVCFKTGMVYIICKQKRSSKSMNILAEVNYN
jgi:hypothetical protein